MACLESPGEFLQVQMPGSHSYRFWFHWSKVNLGHSSLYIKLSGVSDAAKLGQPLTYGNEPTTREEVRPGPSRH